MLHLSIKCPECGEICDYVLKTREGMNSESFPNRSFFLSSRLYPPTYSSNIGKFPLSNSFSSFLEGFIRTLTNCPLLTISRILL